MSLRLYAHALRAARPRQLRARAVRPLARRRFPAEPMPAFAPPAGAVELWRSPAFEPTELAGAGPERLRVFHGHYGEDALQRAREGDAAGARAAMTEWIERNPPRPDDGWHPYTTSTRVGNWLAALALVPDAATREVCSSLWRQLLHLERNVEDDVLGNHVIRNARALALGGEAFSSARLAGRAAELLARELPEQVLRDGGHYERSPVYHLVVLRDLLEIDAVAPAVVPRDVLDRMSRFAAALTRPDGEPALFNDGTLDLAPRLELPPPPEGLSLFPDTGYAVLRRGALWLAFDCGPPSPPYLPAHAHADALSFQLWFDGRPLVVDPGMPTYEPGPERNWFRGTRAHSTVAVGGDQFELWGAFRSGPLPVVELEDATPQRLVATVRGRAGTRHRRIVEIGDSHVVVADEVEGGGPAESSLPLAAGAAIHATALVGHARREERVLAERLYTRVASTALVASGERDLGWTIRLG